MCWSAIPQSQDISLNELLFGPKTEVNCADIIRGELVRILERFRSSTLEVGLVLEMLGLAVAKHWRFVEPMLEGEERGRSLLVVV